MLGACIIYIDVMQGFCFDSALLLLLLLLGDLCIIIFFLSYSALLPLWLCFEMLNLAPTVFLAKQEVH